LTLLDGAKVTNLDHREMMIDYIRIATAFMELPKELRDSAKIENPFLLLDELNKSVLNLRGTSHSLLLLLLKIWKQKHRENCGS
jgi:hypothetical protein